VGESEPVAPGFAARHPGDAKNLPPFISKAPTEAAAGRIRDVLVIPTTHVEGNYDDEPPAGDEAIGISDGIVLERIPHADVELVLNACTQRGHYFLGARQFGQRYTFVRHVDPAMYERELYAWDEENVLFYTMVLSRLVHDNAHSLEYAARVVDHEDGLQQVIPIYAPAYVATSRLRRDRDWLTVPEAEDLTQLLADYLSVKDDLPWKVVHALNLSEEAIHQRVLQRALLLIAIALEGLIQSNRNRIAKQFRERLPQLAEEVGIDGIDEDFARELYEARSEAAHAAPVSMFKAQPQPPAEEQPEQPHGEPEPPEAEPDAVAPLALAQDLLRGVTRRAIQDAEFRQAFDSPESVAARWPVED
jgi:hypothetical protein